jgi:hypothetical protein
LWVRGYVGWVYFAEVLGEYIRLPEGIVDRDAVDGDVGAVQGVVHIPACHAFHE